MADPEIQRLQIGGLGSKRHVNEGIQGWEFWVGKIDKWTDWTYKKLASLLKMQGHPTENFEKKDLKTTKKHE